MVKRMTAVLGLLAVAMFGLVSPASATIKSDCTPYYTTGVEHTDRFCGDMFVHVRADGDIEIDAFQLAPDGNPNEYETDTCGSARFDRIRIYNGNGRTLWDRPAGCTNRDAGRIWDINIPVNAQCVFFAVSDLEPRVNNWNDPGSFNLGSTAYCK